MAFLNVYLLGGLALLGVPVLVHLMMRQKPRRLPFPAFRFLRQRSLINRRRMRLQHLLLLLLRMAVLAALCLAIAQPKLFLPRAVANWFGLGGPSPAAAVLVFDVSYSMEYQVADKGRLDDARQAALDLLRELPPDSRVAVLDTGDENDAADDDDWIGTPAQVRSRINGLRLRPVRAPLARQIERGAEMLAKAGESGEPSSRCLYVFSDRTTTSWDADAAKRIHIPDGVQTAYIDLGVEKPVDLGIDKIEVRPTVVPPGGEVNVHVEVRAVGGDFDANLLCQLDGAGSLETRPVKLSAESRAPAGFDFKLKAPALVHPPGAEGVATEAHQIVVKFSAADDRPFQDALPHDNIRYATFFVRDDSKRPGRRVLAIPDNPKDALYWDAALKAFLSYHPFEGFASEVRSAADAAKFGRKELEPYRVVCLYQNAKPFPDDFCKALEEYVNDGGGLAIVPPAAPLSPDDLKRWNDALDSHHLLPAPLRDLTSTPDGKPLYWDEFKDDHPLTRPFFDWKRGTNPDFANEELKPFVRRYWEVEPVEGKSLVISTYVGGSPALVELKRGEGDKEEKRGRVLLFTTRLNRPDPKDASDRDWNNFYTDSSFGLVLINEACKYLAGDSSMENPNFICGDPVVLPLPASAPRGVYRLNTPDPDLTESERSITVAAGDKMLEVRAASAPGSYTVFDPNRSLYTAFSLNVSPDEARLDRLPAEAIEKALGPGSVLAAGPGLSAALRDRARTATTAEPPPAPVDLLPLLMMLTLLFLTFEGLLANRFYERPSPSAAAEPRGEQAPS